MIGIMTVGPVPLRTNHQSNNVKESQHCKHDHEQTTPKTPDIFKSMHKRKFPDTKKAEKTATENTSRRGAGFRTFKEQTFETARCCLVASEKVLKACRM